MHTRIGYRVVIRLFSEAEDFVGGFHQVYSGGESGDVEGAVAGQYAETGGGVDFHESVIGETVDGQDVAGYSHIEVIGSDTVNSYGSGGLAYAQANVTAIVGNDHCLGALCLRGLGGKRTA